MAVVAYYVRTPPQAQRLGTIQRADSKTYYVGDFIDVDFATPTSARSWVYYCTTAGTSGGSTPTFTQSEGGTTSDGSVVWTAHKATNPAYPAAGRWAIYQDIKENHMTDYIVIYADYGSGEDYVTSSPMDTIFPYDSTRPPAVTVVSYDFGSGKPRRGGLLHDGTQSFFGAGTHSTSVDDYGTRSYHWQDSLTSSKRKMDAIGTLASGRAQEFIDCRVRWGGTNRAMYGETRGTYFDNKNAAGNYTDFDILSQLSSGFSLIGVTVKQAGVQVYDNISDLVNKSAFGLHYDYAYTNLAYYFGGGYVNASPAIPIGGTGWVSSTAEQVNYCNYNGSGCSWLWTTAMYRDSAATIGAANGSFLWYGMNVSCSLGAPIVSPYIGAYLTTSGAKTFTVEFITECPFPLFTDEVWLDVYYPSAAGTWVFSLATTLDSNVGLAAHSRTGLTTSSVAWTNGTGLDSSYFTKYKLVRTATLGRAGPVYVRLVCATDKLATFSRTYVCPQVDVT